MRVISILLVLVITAFLVGCVPVDSLNPIYTDKDVIFESALVGTWMGQNPDEGDLRITRAGDNAYQLVMNERESGSWLKGKCFRCPSGKPGRTEVFRCSAKAASTLRSGGA